MLPQAVAEVDLREVDLEDRPPAGLADHRAVDPGAAAATQDQTNHQGMLATTTVDSNDPSIPRIG